MQNFANGAYKTQSKRIFMTKTAVFLSNGTEEIEAVTAIDVLRRGGATCHIVSIDEETVVGSHGIAIKADKLIGDFDVTEYDALIIPGGLKGAQNISQNLYAVAAIKQAAANGKVVAAICAAPALVLAKHGLLNGKKATCYPAEDFVKLLSAAQYKTDSVVTDGNIITADGPLSAMEFALAVCDALKLNPSF